MTVPTRKLALNDRAAWAGLWRGYLEFYGASVSAAVTETTWSRLLDDNTPMWGWLAEDGAGGEPIGLVHYILHLNTWTERPVCYLEDLFVAPDARGRGAGRTLIDRVVDLAEAHHWHRVYWMTDAENRTARALYDRVATLTNWVRYDVNTANP